MRLCANCGEPIFKVTFSRGDYWMHKVGGGGDSACHLNAEPLRYLVRWQDRAKRWRWTVHFTEEAATAALAEVQKTYPNAYAVRS